MKVKIILKDDIPKNNISKTYQKNKTYQKQIEEWIRLKIIRVSNSDYASSITIVKKKDGTIRICIDYRLLNKKVIKNRYPIPIIDDLLDFFKGACVYNS